MTDLLCMFTQTVVLGAYSAPVVIAAPDMAAAQNLIGQRCHAGHLLWGPCKIVKGARVSGEPRIIVGILPEYDRGG